MKKRILMLSGIVIFSGVILMACNKELDRPEPVQEKVSYETNNEPISKKSIDKDSTDYKYGTSLMHTVGLYLEKKSNVTEKLRTSIADLIEDGLLWFNEENKGDFSLLANYIRNNDNEEVEKLYNKLKEKYPPDEVSNSAEEVSKDGMRENTVQSNTTFENVVAALSKSKVDERIAEDALSKWGDNVEMKDYTVSNQTEAYNRLVSLNVDSVEKGNILNKALDKWGYDFGMVEYTYNNQLNALMEISDLTLDSAEKKEALEQATRKWNTDYEMIIYEYNKRINN